MIKTSSCLDKNLIVDVYDLEEENLQRSTVIAK